MALVYARPGTSLPPAAALGMVAQQRWLACLAARELGPRSVTAARAVDAAALSLRAGTVQLSTHIELSQTSDAVMSLSLEAIDERYLLAGCADGSMALYDVADVPSMPKGPPDAREPLVRVSKRTCPGAHDMAISSLQWFPHDTGAFISSGYDGVVKLWDTNTMAPACAFETSGRVHCACMSEVASKHNLIATCSDGDSADVVLFDPLVGHTAHRLAGHRGVPWSLCWSPRSEYELVSGGSDGSLRLWDIRKNIRGCLRAFDQHHTFARMQAATASAASGGGSSRDRSATSASDMQSAPLGGGAQRGRGGGGGGLAAGSLAATARRLADPKAHHGGITSVAFSADGSVLLSAGRDHRLRLWNAASGENLLVHYEDAYNKTRSHKQIALSPQLGRAGSRAYFPSTDALRVYNLFTGELLQVLKGHFGEVLCVAAAAADHKLFSGGDDGAINVWTPPPCGLTAPAPVERCRPPERAGSSLGWASSARDAAGGAHSGTIVDFIQAPNRHGAPAGRGGAGSSSSSGALPVRAEVDEDAWSEDDEPPPTRPPPKRRRRIGQ